MTKLYQKLFIFILIPLYFGCKKYEEGPALSLTSKTKRLSNTWQNEKTLSSDNVTYSGYSNYKITFTQEGYFFHHNEFLNYTGTWKFTNDEKEIEIEVTDTSSVVKKINYEILKLKKNELWIKDKSDNQQYHMIPS